MQRHVEQTHLKKSHMCLCCPTWNGGGGHWTVFSPCVGFPSCHPAAPELLRLIFPVRIFLKKNHTSYENARLPLAEQRSAVRPDHLRLSLTFLANISSSVLFDMSSSVDKSPPALPDLPESHKLSTEERPGLEQEHGCYLSPEAKQGKHLNQFDSSPFNIAYDANTKAFISFISDYKTNLLVLFSF